MLSVFFYVIRFALLFSLYLPLCFWRCRQPTTSANTLWEDFLCTHNHKTNIFKCVYMCVYACTATGSIYVCITLFKISLKENFGHPIPCLLSLSLFTLLISLPLSHFLSVLKQTKLSFFNCFVCCNIPTVTFGMIYIVRMQMWNFSGCKRRNRKKKNEPKKIQSVKSNRVIATIVCGGKYVYIAVVAAAFMVFSVMFQTCDFHLKWLENRKTNTVTNVMACLNAYFIPLEIERSFLLLLFSAEGCCRSVFYTLWLNGPVPFPYVYTLHFRQ